AAQLLRDAVLVAVVCANDRERGVAERGFVTAENLDRQLAREREQRRIVAHSRRMPSSLSTCVQSPPSSTGFSATSGRLVSGLPSSEILTSRTRVPSRSGAISCAVRSIVAASAA